MDIKQKFAALWPLLSWHQKARIVIVILCMRHKDIISSHFIVLATVISSAILSVLSYVYNNAPAILLVEGAFISLALVNYKGKFMH